MGVIIGLTLLILVVLLGSGPVQPMIRDSSADNTNKFFLSNIPMFNEWKKTHCRNVCGSSTSTGRGLFLGSSNLMQLYCSFKCPNSTSTSSPTGTSTSTTVGSTTSSIGTTKLPSGGADTTTTTTVATTTTAAPTTTTAAPTTAAAAP